jgi:hypothetical protein
MVYGLFRYRLLLSHTPTRFCRKAIHLKTVNGRLIPSGSFFFSPPGPAHVLSATAVRPHAPMCCTVYNIKRTVEAARGLDTAYIPRDWKPYLKWDGHIGLVRPGPPKVSASKPPSILFAIGGRSSIQCAIAAVPNQALPPQRDMLLIPQTGQLDCRFCFFFKLKG